ncbi:MAG TPA: rod shape-determining protein MreD [Acidobacteriota bacterium]|nr:rod shape-determining protein MreD [Acidobacteriota bacterium]|tara:strand:+ start:10161 stop:10694 length:534 start_codon:yes stop_codon:yes gene_type:complete
MTALFSVLLLFGLGLLQIFVPQVWSGLGRIDWLLMYVVLQSLRSSFRRSILLGAGAGLIQDGLAGGIIGLHAFAKTIIAAIITMFSSLFVLRGPLSGAMITGLAVIVERLILMAWHLSLTQPTSLGMGDLWLGVAATSATTMLVVYAGRKWEQRQLVKQRRGRVQVDATVTAGDDSE